MVAIVALVKKGDKMRKTVTCKYCGKKFVSKCFWAKYCCKEHKVKGWHIAKAKKYIKGSITTLAIVLFTFNCYAYTNTQIANAIYKSENSKTHPYGILTHYKHTTPRQACLNTIAHAKRDWNGKGDFIVFLGNRYCPVGANNDPKGLNKNWVKNVRYFLRVK